MEMDSASFIQRPKLVPQAADLHERARDVSQAGKVNPLLDSDKAREVVAAGLDMASTQVHVVTDAAKADQILAAAVTAGEQLPATLVDAPRRTTRASIALLSNEIDGSRACACGPVRGQALTAWELNPETLYRPDCSSATNLHSNFVHFFS